LGESAEESTGIFKEKMEAFLFQAEKKLIEKEKDLQYSKNNFQNTVDNYNFVLKNSAETKTPGQFFEQWNSFCTDFNDLWKREINQIRESM
jgi:formin 2